MKQFDDANFSAELSSHFIAGADFEELFLRWRGFAICYACKRLSQTVTKDIVAESFLTPWKKTQTGSVTPTRPYLLAILRNKMGDYIRQAKREVLTSDIKFETRQTEFETRLIDSIVLKTLLPKLSKEHKQALYLTYWVGLTASDAATILGIPAATFRKRLSRARRELSKALETIGAVPHGREGHLLEQKS